MKKLALLLILALCLAPAALAERYVPLNLSAKEQYAVNLFLSNFTEVGVQKIDAWSDEAALVDFAHDHMWFNSNDDFKYGDYFGDNNCRVADDRIQKIIDDYFHEAPKVDLWQTRFDYDGEYYYHCETGGWSDCGFAYAASVCPMGGDRYFVSFVSFGMGCDWDNDVLDDDIGDLIDEYGAPTAHGSAVIRAKDLSKRSSYKMEALSMI